MCSSSLFIFFFLSYFSTVTWRTSAGMEAASTWSCCEESNVRLLSLHAMAAVGATVWTSLMSTGAMSPMSLLAAPHRMGRMENELANLASFPAHRSLATAKTVKIAGTLSMRMATAPWRQRSRPQRAAPLRTHRPMIVHSLAPRRWYPITWSWGARPPYPADYTHACLNPTKLSQ